MVPLIHVLSLLVFSKLFAGFLVHHLKKRLPSGTTATQTNLMHCAVYGRITDRLTPPPLQPLQQCFSFVLLSSHVELSAATHLVQVVTSGFSIDLQVGFGCAKCCTKKDFYFWWNVMVKNHHPNMYLLAALTCLFPKHNLWIWCWARALNFFSRPWRGLFWVEPVLLYCCMVLVNMLQLSFSVLAIFV